MYRLQASSTRREKSFCRSLMPAPPQQADFIRLQWEQTQRISEVTELQKVQDQLPCMINCSAKVAKLGALLRI